MNHKYSILIVEEDKSIGNYLDTVLSANGYKVLRAYDGSGAMMSITSCCPDLVLLELELPDMDGAEIIKSLRKWSKIPILVVSFRNLEKDKVEALDLGADDYITKPFGSAELLARIRAAIRHSENANGASEMPASGRFESGDLVVDYNIRHVFLKGQDVKLTRNEYKIVALLSRYAGRVMTYDSIIKAIWGPNVDSDNQILRVNMANIRRKIEQDPANPMYIFTQTGVGYRMRAES